ncbi:MAG: long-chain fatty acid transport protein [Cyclobacteriaceae bacterium]|nr:long-chain fatty acid transport protein [Cyclobacteriaceae bacterium]
MKRTLTALIGALLLGPFVVTAQDGHYWTQQYGTKSMLLSGSVIGGVEDLGAVYYNPARLAVIENPAFLLSASVYEMSKIEASDIFGNSKGASKAEFKGVPTLAAGTFKVKFLPKHHFAYAIMTRQQSDVSTSYKNEVYQDVFSTLPGDEYFSGEMSITNKANEQWFGLTWSHTLSSKMSVGVTTNYVTNTQTKGSAIELHALSSSNEVAIYQYDRNYTYQENGLLWKAGLSGNFGKWNLGLTIKTPLLSFSGSGSYNYEEYLSTIPGLGPQPEVYKTSSQEGIAMKTKSPWAIGLGATRALGRNKIHFSTEWYSAIPKYTVMQATRHFSQSTPTDTLDFLLTDQMKSVWNAGIGMEFFISEHISGFASFSTDFTTVTDDITRFLQRQDEASNSSWKADFYHWGGGVVLDFKGADITLGVTHTGAQQTIPRLLNFPDGGGGGIFDPNSTADLKWDRWRFVFSFSFPFLADYAKKLEGGK